MKIILRDDVEKVGLAGEVKTVSDGYARNYLLPRGLAMSATDANLRRWETEKRVREIKLNRDVETAQKTASQLEQISLSLSARSGRDGHLFGSITSQMIAEALLEKGFSIDKKAIRLESPIKALGDHPVPVKLHPRVSAQLKLTIVSSNPEEAHQAGAPSGEQETAPVS